MALSDSFTIFHSLLRFQLSPTEYDWLRSKGEASPLELMTAFVAVPRFVARQPVQASAEHSKAITESIAGFSIEGWTMVRLSRVWLLTRLDSSDRETYVRHIETLFDTAEMNELVALYSALPLLGYPEHWLFRATEAVRSNVGDVFDALVMHNPYPAQYFTEAAWNQLVLKTIFNDKPIHNIVGLEKRANATLAQILSDFAHERWAAGRSVAPEVWRLTPRYLDETGLEDMKHLFTSSHLNDQRAAALVCFQAGTAEAQALLAQYPELERQVQQQEISWANLELKDLNTYAAKS